MQDTQVEVEKKKSTLQKINIKNKERKGKKKQEKKQLASSHTHIRGDKGSKGSSRYR